MSRHSVANQPVRDHQHGLARRQRVDQRRFPRAGPRGGVDHHGPGGADHPPHSAQHGAPQFGEAGSAMVDGRFGDRPQHAIGHVGRARNLQEVAAGDASVHNSISPRRVARATASRDGLRARPRRTRSLAGPRNDTGPRRDAQARPPRRRRMATLHLRRPWPDGHDFVRAAFTQLSRKAEWDRLRRDRGCGSEAAGQGNKGCR